MLLEILILNISVEWYFVVLNLLGLSAMIIQVQFLVMEPLPSHFDIKGTLLSSPLVEAVIVAPHS
jgi:hypothetical protein